MPLSDAYRGVKTNGLYGSTGGDIARVIKDFVAQGKEESERKRKAALEQSLADQKLAEFNYNKDKDKRDFDATEAERKLRESDRQTDNERMAREGEWRRLDSQQDNIRAESQFRQMDDFRRQTQESLDAYRTESLGVRREGQDLARELGRGRLAQGAEKVAQGWRRVEQGDTKLDQGERALQLQGYEKYEDESGQVMWMRKPGAQAPKAVKRGGANPSQPLKPTVQPGQQTDSTSAHPPTSPPAPVAAAEAASPTDSLPSVIASGVHGGKANAPVAISKEYHENKAGIERIRKAKAFVRANPSAFGLHRMFEPVNQYTDPDGTDDRAILSDLGSLRLHERSGANVTKVEIPRQRGWLPEAWNRPEVILQKLDQLEQRYHENNKFYSSAYPHDTNLHSADTMVVAPGEKPPAPMGSVPLDREGELPLTGEPTSPRAYWSWYKAQNPTASNDDATAATLQKFPNAKMK